MGIPGIDRLDQTKRRGRCFAASSKGGFSMLFRHRTVTRKIQFPVSALFYPYMITICPPSYYRLLRLTCRDSLLNMASKSFVLIRHLSS